MTPLQRRIAASLAVMALAGAAICVNAQTPATPAAPAAVSKHSCESPGDFPGRLASDAQKRAWQKNVNSYLDCLKKFIADEHAVADPYIKAANAATEEYNTAAKKFNAQIQEANKQD